MMTSTEATNELLQADAKGLLLGIANNVDCYVFLRVLASLFSWLDDSESPTTVLVEFFHCAPLDCWEGKVQTCEKVHEASNKVKGLDVRDGVVEEACHL